MRWHVPLSGPWFTVFGVRWVLQVRQVAQAVLFRCVSHCQQAFLVLWPSLVELLGKPEITHEQLKVRSTVTVRGSYSSVLTPSISTRDYSDSDSTHCLNEMQRY